MANPDQMEAFLAVLAEGVVVLDEADAVIYTNQAARRLLALRDEQHLGQPLFFELPAATGDAHELHPIYPRPGVVLRARVFEGEWEQRPVRLVVIDDSTVRHQEPPHGAQEWIGEHAHGAIITTDLGGTVTSWNGGAERMFGFTRSEMLGRSIARLYPADRYDSLRECVIAQMISRTRQSLELDMLRKGKQRFEVLHSLSVLSQADGTPYGLVIHCLDLAEHRRAELGRAALFGYDADMDAQPDAAESGFGEYPTGDLDLRLRALLKRERQAHAEALQQRELLQGLLDQAPAVMCIMEGPEHVYRYVNDIFCQGLGRDEADVLGKPLREVMPEIAHTGIYEIMDHVYRTGESARALEQRVPVDVNRDGLPEETFFTYVFQPMRAPEGEVAGILVHAINVTESVLAQRALEQKNQEIARLNRDLEQRVIERTAQLQAANKELKAFAYSVSHDLRAPLRRIDGFSQALLEDFHDVLPAEGQDFLQRIRASTQYMGELIDDLLSLSQITTLPLSEDRVDLSGMAREILRELAEQAPERKVTIEVAPDMSVHGDSKFLRIALENLLNNAWKFTGKQDEARIEVGMNGINGHRVFFVRDNGAGFDPAFKTKLFNTFNRLHSPAEFPGTGIGLATVKRVFDRHGGCIWADGEVGKGAVFYFTLPGAGTLRR